MVSSFRNIACHTLLILGVIFTVLNVRAQDTITMTDGTIRTGDILKLTELKVYWVSDKGDTLHSTATNVHHLIIEGNRVELASRQKQLGEAFRYRNNSQNIVATQNLEYKNFIRFNMFNLLLRSIDLSYERRILKGYIGIRVPVYVGYKLSNETSSEQFKNYATGIDINFYPFVKGNVGLFGGIGIEHGEMRTRPVFNTISPFFGQGQASESDFSRDVPYLAFTFNGGITTSINEHFALSFELDVGIRSETFGQFGQFLRLGRDDNSTREYGRFCIGLGYTF